MDPSPPRKPAEFAESQLLDAILDGTYPVNSTLPNERDLADQLGITRPTLREALQRLARDGWLDIQQGKSTRVRDYWKEGRLATLSALASSPHHQSPDFVAYLLEIRLLLAPTYARQAIENANGQIADLLQDAESLDQVPEAYALFDWKLHHSLTEHASNPIFQLLLNGFREIYSHMGRTYFSFPECRAESRKFYQALKTCAETADLPGTEDLLRKTMQGSLNLWLRLGSS
ncbi:MAG: fatty acid metabolism transcriptional regulator FadR [Anaerolineales bacterium]|jgi:GntR family negative regulator for fad regulon and positive regulator of fabA